MLAKIQQVDMQQLKIRQRIKRAILIRLELFEEIKPTITKTVAFLSLPWNIINATQFMWRTCDLIWYEAGGDNSTDFNHYTKRSLLMGVYSSTLMYWLSDNSKDYLDTEQFLDDRIDNVMKFGQFIGNIGKNCRDKYNN